MRYSVVLLLLLCAGQLHGQQETIIKGKLLGYDKKPMALSHVHILKMPNPQPIAQAQSGNDGSFEVRTRETGALVVEFTGVNHRALDVPLIIDTPLTLSLSVSLQTYEYKREFTDVKVMSDVTEFAFEKAQPMKRQPDGTFVLEVATPKETLAYQLFGVEGTDRSINGTQSESYRFDNAGDYQSVISAPGGRARIVFDPAKLVRSSEPYSVSFQEPGNQVARVAMIQLKMLKRAEMQASSSGQNVQGQNWGGELQSVVDRLKQEKTPLVRQALLLEYLDIKTRSGLKGDPKVGSQALREIPPESKLWMMPTLPLMKSAADLAGDQSLYGEYLEKFLGKNADESLKSNLLMNLLMSAKMQGNEKELKSYYDMAIQYMGETQFGKMVKERFKPTIAISLGRTIPTFAVKALDDPNTVYSNASFKGKATLLDFWATWCGPCVAEMENLHKAYERFKSKGFQILSLSLDQKPEDVRKFRSEKWKMPWLHTFVTNDKDLTNAFEVVAIPRPILMDGEGRIVALDADLRGEQLARTLEKFLK